MPQIIVNIDAAGNVQVDACGVSGPGCGALTEAIERAIGRTTADQKKPEYHHAAGVHSLNPQPSTLNQ